MRAARPIFWILFFISGALGLVYEVVELRLLHLAIGSNAISVYVVLSSFMAGIAIGSFAGGKYLDRVKRPLLAYALLEFGVALASSPFFFVGRWGNLLGSLFTPDVLRESGFLPFWRAFLSFLFLLPPSSFMGATLPALSRFYLVEERKGLEIGRLYAFNTFGAVIGCFCTGFFFIDHFGVFGTLTLAIAGSLSIGFLSLLIAFQNPQEVLHSTSPLPSGQAGPGTILVIFALSGMTALAAETIWTRILKFSLRTDVYAFSVMLSVFLAALAAGSALAAAIVDRLAKPKLGFALVQAWIGITSLLSLRMFRSVAEILGPSNAVISPLEIVEATLKSCSLMLLPVLGFGAVFPLVIRIASDARFPARSTGRLLAANTMGAAAGPIIAGFALVPLFGTAGSLAVLAGLNVILAAILARFEMRVKWIFGATAVAIFCLVPGLKSKKDPYLLPVFNVDSNGPRPDRPLLWFDEGYDVSAGVFRDQAGIADPNFKSLNVNGISYSATSFRSRRYMKSLSYLPALLHPQPKRILVVCLGTGITAGAAARIPGVEAVDVVELSSTILEALPVFAEETGNIGSLKQVRMIVDDGRNYLQTTSNSYDIITAEPPPPREAGVVNLYTTEYYEILKRRLSPGGLAVQWVPLTGQSVSESRALVATFAASFPNVTLWLPVPTQLILIGSGKRPNVRITDPHPWWNSKDLERDLLMTGFRSPLDLLATFIPSGGLLTGGKRITDAAPVVEYFRRFGQPASGNDLLGWLQDVKAAPVPGIELSDPLQKELLRKMELEGKIRRGDWVFSIPLLEYALSLDPEHLYLQRDLAITTEQRQSAARLRESNPKNPEYWDIEARLAARAGDFPHSEKILLQAIRQFPEMAAFPIRLSDLYRNSGKNDEAKNLLRKLKVVPSVQLRLELIDLQNSLDLEKQKRSARILFELGDWVSAANLYRQILPLDPDAAKLGLEQIESK